AVVVAVVASRADVAVVRRSVAVVVVAIVPAGAEVVGVAHGVAVVVRAGRCRVEASVQAGVTRRRVLRVIGRAGVVDPAAVAPAAAPAVVITAAGQGQQRANTCDEPPTTPRHAPLRAGRRGFGPAFCAAQMGGDWWLVSS